jgi:hypothetical protein
VRLRIGPGAPRRRRTLQRRGGEAHKRIRLAAKPYLNIEYGYEKGARPIKTYTSRTTREWDEVLLWTWAIYAGGGYPCYYYSNAAWDLIAPAPEPPGWKRYRYLADFLAGLDLGPMAPANDLVASGFCLAEPGSQYLVLLPEGGDLAIDLGAIAAGAEARCEWMDIRSGERAGNVAGATNDRRAAAKVPNPLPDTAAPCVVAVRAASA